MMEAKNIERGMRQPRYRRAIMCVCPDMLTNKRALQTPAHSASIDHLIIIIIIIIVVVVGISVCLCVLCMRACLRACVRAIVRVCNVCVWTMPKAPLRSVVSVV